MSSFGDSGLAKRLAKAGVFGFKAERAIQQRKGQYVIVNLTSKEGEVTLSAGVSNGKGYDNITRTCEALSICTPQVTAVRKASPSGRESKLIALAKAVGVFFKTEKKVKVSIAKDAKSKTIKSKKDGLPLVNLVSLG